MVGFENVDFALVFAWFLEDQLTDGFRKNDLAEYISLLNESLMLRSILI